MSKELIKGGAFLISKSNPEDVFTPEDFDQTHKMIASMSRDFVTDKVLPKTDEIEAMEEGVVVNLLREAGELGLLGVDIPEKYGGEEGDKISTLIVTENLSLNGSFATAFGAHTGIGTLPIVLFGNEEQKAKYLPGLASGEKIAAYALTEPEAGSDALNCKTRAVLSECGNYYILNGAKQYITNAAWAHVIVTYAKIDNEKFTAFIVEGGSPGVSIAPEEKKMGLKGSSTCSVIFEDAKVPVENVLWEIGKGHQVAFNILNIGRFKLGAGCAGAGKYVLANAVDYALQRVQFKMPIAKFGLIKSKIADMAILNYVMESMLYRSGGLIEDILSSFDLEGEDAGKKIADGIQEYAIECSINKIFCSEAFDFIADEGVQIYGGYGYGQEYPMERAYRDSRINRIFEGTNEINRLIIPATLMRKAMKGEIALIQAAQKLQEELMMPIMADMSDELLAEQENLIENMKKVFLMVSGTAVQKYGEAIQKEQEILGRMADMAIQVFAAESAYLRAKKIIQEKGEEAAELAIKMTECFVAETMPKFDLWGKEMIAAMEEGDVKRTLLSALRKLTRFEFINLYERKRYIANEMYETKKYFVLK